MYNFTRHVSASQLPIPEAGDISQRSWYKIVFCVLTRAYRENLYKRVGQILLKTVLLVKIALRMEHCVE